MKKLLLLTAFALIWLSGCYYDKEDKLYPQTVGCDTTQVTYSSKVKNIFTTRCATAGCHNSGSLNGDYSTYSGLAPDATSGLMNTRVFVDKNMPPMGATGLSACESAQLKIWLNNGAQNN